MVIIPLWTRDTFWWKSICGWAFISLLAPCVAHLVCAIPMLDSGKLIFCCNFKCYKQRINNMHIYQTAFNPFYFIYKLSSTWSQQYHAYLSFNIRVGQDSMHILHLPLLYVHSQLLVSQISSFHTPCYRSQASFPMIYSYKYLYWTGIWQADFKGLNKASFGALCCCR